MLKKYRKKKNSRSLNQKQQIFVKNLIKLLKRNLKLSRKFKTKISLKNNPKIKSAYLAEFPI